MYPKFAYVQVSGLLIIVRLRRRGTCMTCHIITVVVTINTMNLILLIFAYRSAICNELSCLDNPTPHRVEFVKHFACLRNVLSVDLPSTSAVEVSHIDKSRVDRCLFLFVYCFVGFRVAKRD